MSLSCSSSSNISSFGFCCFCFSLFSCFDGFDGFDGLPNHPSAHSNSVLRLMLLSRVGVGWLWNSVNHRSFLKCSIQPIIKWCLIFHLDDFLSKNEIKSNKINWNKEAHYYIAAWKERKWKWKWKKEECKSEQRTAEREEPHACTPRGRRGGEIAAAVAFVFSPPFEESWRCDEGFDGSDVEVAETLCAAVNIRRK